MYETAGMTGVLVDNITIVGRNKLLTITPFRPGTRSLMNSQDQRSILAFTIHFS